MEHANPDLVLDFKDVLLRRGANTLVGPVDWQVELDERWVILGPNGAGKTSLLRLASAQEHPTAGVAHVLGERLGRVDVAELRPRVGLASAAILPQIPPDELAEDLVMSAGHAVVGRWKERYEQLDEQRAHTVLGMLGARKLVGRRFGTLSEGERKRVLIARALMADPEILLLDEPSAGLDLGGREDLVAQLSALAADPEAPAIVMVTHHVEEIPPGFSHAMLLRSGEIVAQGLLAEVITSKNLSLAFEQPLVLAKAGGRFYARRSDSLARRLAGGSPR